MKADDDALSKLAPLLEYIEILWFSYYPGPGLCFDSLSKKLAVVFNPKEYLKSYFFIDAGVYYPGPG